MGKSVKLADGSYIDAEGVWDNALGKSQADINAVETYDLGTIISTAGGEADRAFCCKVGKMCFVIAAFQMLSEVAAMSTVFSMPKGYRPSREIRTLAIPNIENIAARPVTIYPAGDVKFDVVLPANSPLTLVVMYPIY